MTVLANSSELDILHLRNVLMECQGFSCLKKITTPMCQQTDNILQLKEF